MNPTGRAPSRGVSTPLAAAARPPCPYSGRARISISLAAFGVCVLTFLPLSGLFGAPAAALAAIPVMASGWLFGAWAGLFAEALTIPLNTLLLNRAGYAGWDALIRLDGLETPYAPRTAQSSANAEGVMIVTHYPTYDYAWIGRLAGAVVDTRHALRKAGLDKVLAGQTDQALGRTAAP